MTPDRSHSDTFGRVAKQVRVENIALLTHFLRQRFFILTHQYVTIKYSRLVANFYIYDYKYSHVKILTCGWVQEKLRPLFEHDPHLYTIVH